MTRCHLDIESYSEGELKSQGVYAYAQHPTTEVTALVYTFDDEAAVLWVPPSPIGTVSDAIIAEVKRRHPTATILVGGPVPARLRKYIESGGEVAAHNAQFERVVLNGVAGKKIGFPNLSIEQMVCTAAKCRVHGLPASLEDAAEALNTHRKDDTARGTMLQLARPRSGAEKRWTYAEVPEKYAHLFAYCIDDVYAERGIDKVLKDLILSEREVWQLDQRINDRGVKVDVPMIHIVQQLIAEYKKEMEALCYQLTYDDLMEEGLKPTQRAQLADWCRQRGFPQLENMTADYIRKTVKDDKTCPEQVKTILKIFSTYGMKAVSKFDTMLEAMCSDERIRGMFLYYGAGTGRWSSRIVQLQNLFRPVIDDCENAIDAFRQRDLSYIKFLYDGVDPMKVFASCVRGMLIAQDDDHILQSIDFAGIESRVLAWLFDEEWKLKAFRAVDADPSKPDNYEIAYAMCFGLSPYEISKKQRQVGKPIDLGLGFEGGVGAFVTLAPNYGVDLNELVEAARPNLPAEALESANWMWENIEVKKRGNSSGLDYKMYTTIDAIKYQWRQGHPMIVQGWKDMLEAAKRAVQDPGQAYAIPNGKIKFFMKGDWLYMRLPSGRKLNYFKPELHDKTPKKIREQQEATARERGQVWKPELRYVDLTYMGMDTDRRIYMRTGTYGGKLTENAVQAIAGDLLRGAMLRLEKAGYKIIMTVHDEIVCEILKTFSSLEAAIKLMLVPEPWAPDLPINAEGWRAREFRK